MRPTRILAAELIGTTVLMLGGPGTAILATGTFFPDGSVGVLGVALAFGFSLLVMAYAIGGLSGCHINPAVTIGLLLARKVSPALVPFYLIGQLAGAIAGGLVLWVIASGAPGSFDASPENFAVNGWANLSPGGFGFGAMVVTEVLMTALLVFVVLSTVHRRFAPAASGLAVGLALALIHLISIPVDNTSVNPARSLGVAVFAGGDALEQLWAFIVFPLAGAALGVLAWWAVDDSRTLDEAVEEPAGPGAEPVPGPRGR
jgi:aquaporin Z